MWWIIGFSILVVYWMIGVVFTALVLKYQSYPESAFNCLIVFLWPVCLLVWAFQYAPDYVCSRWLENTKANQGGE